MFSYSGFPRISGSFLMKMTLIQNCGLNFNEFVQNEMRFILTTSLIFVPSVQPGIGQIAPERTIGSFQLLNAQPIAADGQEKKNLYSAKAAVLDIAKSNYSCRRIRSQCACSTWRSPFRQGTAAAAVAAAAAVLPSSRLHTTSLLLLLLIQHSPRLIPETIGSKNMQPSLNEMFPVAEKAGKNQQHVASKLD